MLMSLVDLHTPDNRVGSTDLSRVTGASSLSKAELDSGDSKVGLEVSQDQSDKGVRGSSSGVKKIR